MKKRACLIFGLMGIFSGVIPGSIQFLNPEAAQGVDRDASMIAVVKHEYHIDETWEKIGKTKYIWKVTFENHSDVRKRVYAYYYLLDADGVPLARNVANRYVGPRQTAEIVANSYIMTHKVPEIANSRVRLKVGFPN
ncbi:MAG: hypothetical protein ACE5F7_09540 [Nitrospiria bacterium]